MTNKMLEVAQYISDKFLEKKSVKEVLIPNSKDQLTMIIFEDNSYIKVTTLFLEDITDQLKEKI